VDDFSETPLAASFRRAWIDIEKGCFSTPTSAQSEINSELESIVLDFKRSVDQHGFSSLSFSTLPVYPDVLDALRAEYLARTAEDSTRASWLDYGHEFYVGLRVSGKVVTIFSVSIDSDRRKRIAEMADRIQEELMYILREPVPICPGHQHAMQPHAGPERAVWWCPRDHQIQFEIGAYTK
jgi:hypothetical protein